MKENSVKDTDSFKIHNFSSGWPLCSLASGCTTLNYAAARMFNFIPASEASFFGYSPHHWY
jgi:hypothetical protein